MKQKAFTITQQKGFQIVFPNGYILSTQFGPANYCDNYNMDIWTEGELAGKQGSNQVEIAIFKDDELIRLPKKLRADTEGIVDGYIDIEKWLKYVKWVSKQK